MSPPVVPEALGLAGERFSLVGARLADDEPAEGWLGDGEGSASARRHALLRAALRTGMLALLAPTVLLLGGRLADLGDRAHAGLAWAALWRSLVRRRARRLARPVVVAALAEVPEGRLVALRGRVRPAGASVVGPLSGFAAVARRVEVTLVASVTAGRAAVTLVEDTVADLELVDRTGAVVVRGGGARTLADVPSAERLEREEERVRLLGAGLPEVLRTTPAWGGSLVEVRAAEVLVREGDEVVIYGARGSDLVATPHGRMPVARPTVRGLPGRPLLVVPSREA